MEDLTGVVIDNYKIESTLGKGGMGVVYKGYDIKLDRYVAIKLMSAKMFENERNIERFKREAKNQAKLLHPNIVTVYGFIEYSDLLGIVMEYVEGDSLEKVIYKQKSFSLYDTVYVLRQIFNGMTLAHAKGFIHRDIKPSNIIFNSEGVCKIMDFGISKSSGDARFTKTGSKLGTVYYMSPEQIRGEEVTHLSDIYSLGCTMYEMLTGEPPFYYKSEYEIMDAHCNKEPKPVSQIIPGMPVFVDEIIAKAMEKNPGDRYPSCEDFNKALDRIDMYIHDIKNQSAQKDKKRKTKTKTFSLIGVFGFIGILIIASYLILTQAKELLQSGKIEEFDRQHNIQSMFTDNSVGDEIDVTKKFTGVYNELNSIRFAGNYGVVTADSGAVLTTSDGGENWELIPLDSKAILYDSYIAGNGKTIVVGDSSFCIAGNNKFEKVDRLEMPPGFSLFRISFINSEIGFILGSHGLIMRTMNGGNTWERIRVETSQNLYDIDFINDKTGFVVGWDGVILKTTDMGRTWETQEKFTTKYLKSVDFINEETGIVVGGGGTIYKTNNGGEKWNEVIAPQSGSFQKIRFINEDLALIIANKGLVLHSSNEGSLWRVVNTGVYTNLNDITTTSDGKIYTVGVNGTVLKLY